MCGATVRAFVIALIAIIVLALFNSWLTELPTLLHRFKLQMTMESMCVIPFN
jgi:ATP adenylyltransferase/5',5'''-P-1,P-4-tetraphosphate phosphorylase II